jgi:hypothetical protein
MRGVVKKEILPIDSQINKCAHILTVKCITYTSKKKVLREAHVCTNCEQ